jgi:CelD/BcsL family acetyltransferase involved in cellulose biosynthesis
MSKRVGEETLVQSFGRLKTLKRVQAEYKALNRKAKKRNFTSQDNRRMRRVGGMIFKCARSASMEIL